MCSRNSALLILTAWAMMGQVQPPAAAPGNGSVSGDVSNSLTGAPVPRARVQVIIVGNSIAQSFTATTDDQGKFTIGGLPPGRIIVNNIERAGFVMTVGAIRPSDAQLRADEKKENLKLTLTPTGAISGRVLDSGGSVVQGAIVSVEGTFGITRAWEINPSMTDEKGRYRISGLPPGRYRVVANPAAMPFPPEIRTDGTREVHYARTYYPDALKEGESQRVEVGGGAEAMGMDIHLVRTPVVTVSGKVSGVAGATTVVRAQSTAAQAVQATARVGRDGSFQIWQLDPGEYMIAAIASQQGGQRRLQSAPVEVEIAGADIEKMALRIVQPFDLVCRLAFDDAKAREMPAPPSRPGQPAASQPQPMPRRFSIRPDGPVFGDLGPSVYAAIEVGANDSFTLASLQPGRYHLMPLWGGVYIKSVTVDDKATQGELLDVSGGPVGSVTITLGGVTGELSGVVSDANGPAAGVRVAIRADRAGSQLMFSVSGADGTYKFAAVPPGRYKALAAEGELLSQFQFSKDLSEFANIAESVDIVAGDKITKPLLKQTSGIK